MEAVAALVLVLGGTAAEADEIWRQMANTPADNVSPSYSIEMVRRRLAALRGEIQGT